MRRLLCRFGIHKWDKIVGKVFDPITFEPKFFVKSRRCKRCNRYQSFNPDGTIFFDSDKMKNIFE